MPSDATEQELVFCGRIRQDQTQENAIELFAVGDQLLKGAALNGIQIAEALSDLAEKLKLNEHNRKWWILAAMASTISMIFIDITVLPVSLPTIQRQLDLNNLTLQWIVNAYTLALATFVLAGGRLGDMLGYRKLFRIGVFFTLR